jgi:hypothetical protein
MTDLVYRKGFNVRSFFAVIGAATAGMWAVQAVGSPAPSLADIWASLGGSRYALIDQWAAANREREHRAKERFDAFHKWKACNDELTEAKMIGLVGPNGIPSDACDQLNRGFTQ